MYTTGQGYNNKRGITMSSSTRTSTLRGLSDQDLVTLYRTGSPRKKDGAYLELHHRYGRQVNGILIKLGVDSKNLEQSDIYAEAQLLFIDSILKFDASRGVQFNTFMEKNISLLIQRYTSKCVCGIDRWAVPIKEEILTPSTPSSSNPSSELDYIKLDEADELRTTLKNYNPKMVAALRALSGYMQCYTYNKSEITSALSPLDKSDLSELLKELGMGKSASRPEIEREIKNIKVPSSTITAFLEPTCIKNSYVSYFKGGFAHVYTYQ